MHDVKTDRRRRREMMVMMMRRRSLPLMRVEVVWWGDDGGASWGGRQTMEEGRAHGRGRGRGRVERESAMVGSHLCTCHCLPTLTFPPGFRHCCSFRFAIIGMLLHGVGRHGMGMRVGAATAGTSPSWLPWFSACSLIPVDVHVRIPLLLP